MKQAKWSDRNKVVSIIAETFADNPGVNWMLSNKGSRNKKIRKLAEYAFVRSYNRNGVFISTNGKGVALFYRSDIQIFSLKEIYYQLRFGLLSIKLSKLKDVLNRESFRKSKRPQNKPYYYFWFLGVLKEGANAAFELNTELIKLSKKEHLPIYLETSIERNKIIYERIGYKTYDYWQDDKKNIEFWFLKWQNK